MFGYPASIAVPVSKSDYVKIISNSVLSGRFLVGLPFGSAQKFNVIAECQTSLPLHSVLHQVSYDPYYCHLPLGTKSGNRGGLSSLPLYEGHLENKERFAIKKYLLIIGKKKNMPVLSHTFTHFST